MRYKYIDYTYKYWKKKNFLCFCVKKTTKYTVFVILYMFSACNKITKSKKRAIQCTDLGLEIIGNARKKRKLNDDPNDDINNNANQNTNSIPITPKRGRRPKKPPTQQKSLEKARKVKNGNYVTSNKYDAICTQLANTKERERTIEECNIFVQLIACLSYSEAITVDEAISKIQSWCGG